MVTVIRSDFLFSKRLNFLNIYKSSVYINKNKKKEEKVTIRILNISLEASETFCSNFMEVKIKTEIISSPPDSMYHL